MAMSVLPTPDFLCVAKALTGGYVPLAATLTTEAVFEAFLGSPEEGRTFFHGHTYTGNPLGAAAALATLDIFEREHVIEALRAKVERRSRYPFIRTKAPQNEAHVELRTNPRNSKTVRSAQLSHILATQEGSHESVGGSTWDGGAD